MSEAPIVSPGVLLGWVGATAAIFALSLYLMGRGGDAHVEAGTSVFSRSAIGYAGFAELMQRLGPRVVKGPAAMRDASERANLIIVTESVTSINEEKRRAIASASNVMFILPKWTGSRNETHAGWIDEARALSPSSADWLIREAGAKGQANWVATPSVWAMDGIDIKPSIGTMSQVIAGSDLRPIIGTAGGILVGERLDNRRRVWIVADPDILANHGLLKGANAELAIKLVNRLVPINGAVVFIETPADYHAPPSNPLRLVFSSSFLPATANALAAIALLLWATMPRFGKPDAAPPSLVTGKQGLIRNAAHLLAFANHREPIIMSYVRSIVRNVARRLRVPRHLDEAGVIAWLDRVGRARGVASDIGDIVQRTERLTSGARADMAELARVARDTYRWKQEMLRGS